MEKIIALIDVNSAFLSWIAAYRVSILGHSEDLRDIPSAVCGDIKSRHGIILAKSGPAKTYGIKTGEPLFQARQKCPHLVVVSPDYQLFVEASRKFINILREMCPKVEQYSIDEAWVDLSGMESLLGPPVLAAIKIKDRIREELGFTVNVGISSNKILAKMAADFTKPDRVHTLFPDEIEKKLWPLPVREMFFIGPATEKKLNLMGIRTLGQLAMSDPEKIKLRLHKPGQLIWNFANGRCDDEVSEEILPNKGYGNSITTPQDIRDHATAHKIILSLSETVSMRMRKDHQAGCCIAVSLRTHEFVNFSRQCTLPQFTDSTLEIYRAACKVFDELWDKTPLRQMGVHMSKVYQHHNRQLSIFELDDYPKLALADSAIDRIREKFGEESIIRATFLQKDVESMGGGLSKHRRTGVTKPV